jgi:hypothetical protein
MAEDGMALIELMQKADGDDFLRAVECPEPTIPLIPWYSR